MKLEGKLKVDFEEYLTDVFWVKDKSFPLSKRYYVKHFNTYPDSFKWGVIVDFCR